MDDVRVLVNWQARMIYANSNTVIRIDGVGNRNYLAL